MDGKMTQWVETPAAKSENPNSICRTHTVGDLNLTSYPLTSTPHCSSCALWHVLMVPLYKKAV